MAQNTPTKSKKHTPGPWGHDRGDSRGIRIQSRITGGTLGNCKRTEDADLIAAAPEMLEALKALKDAADHGVLQLSPAWISLIGDAVTKAEGKA